jgi:hypothetical protein
MTAIPQPLPGPRPAGVFAFGAFSLLIVSGGPLKLPG